jgi:hypothetical protein
MSVHTANHAPGMVNHAPGMVNHASGHGQPCLWTWSTMPLAWSTMALDILDHTLPYPWHKPVSPLPAAALP